MLQIPNLLTLFRSISGPLIALLLYGGELAGVVALAIYICAALTDFLDGWLARRWNDPAFPQAFPWFGSHAYWRGHVDDLRHQLQLLSQRPAAEEY